MLKKFRVNTVLPFSENQESWALDSRLTLRRSELVDGPYNIFFSPSTSILKNVGPIKCLVGRLFGYTRRICHAGIFFGLYNW